VVPNVRLTDRTTTRPTLKAISGVTMYRD
jgi:hypothetical protein